MIYVYSTCAWPTYTRSLSNKITLLCVSARPGYQLKLDFRDSFYIEPSDECKFDYLEIRDGANGYDPLVGSYCGRSFPPIIISTGRALWLRFHSDENAEYSGFRAVYEEVKKPGVLGKMILNYLI